MMMTGSITTKKITATTGSIKIFNMDNEENYEIDINNEENYEINMDENDNIPQATNKHFDHHLIKEY